MCGITAILYKTSGGNANQSVGLQLREMLYTMRHRGVDSTGVTVAGQHFGSDYVVRLALSGPRPVEMMENVKHTVIELGGSVRFVIDFDRFYRLGVGYSGDLRKQLRPFPS
jgi:asparagine synthetase B (glutamine-hydrolysing)